MAEFYASLASTAKRLLTTYGQTVTVTRYVAGAVDPVTSIGTAGTSVTFTSKGAVFNYSNSLVDNAEILSTDKKLILESTTEPQNNDVVTTATGDFTIISIKPLSPSGVVVIYDVQLRS